MKPIDWTAVFRKLYSDYGWTHETVIRMPWTAAFDALGWTGKGSKTSGTKASFAQLAEGFRQRKALQQALTR